MKEPFFNKSLLDLYATCFLNIWRILQFISDFNGRFNKHKVSEIILAIL